MKTKTKKELFERLCN